MAEEEKIPETIAESKSFLSILRVFINDVSNLLNWIFTNNQLGARIRLILWFVIALLVWIGISLHEHPLRMRIDWMQSTLTSMQSMYAPDVLSYILVLAFPLLLMWWLASVYLNDIFELNDFPVARKFILQTAFAIRYRTVLIRDGDATPEDKNTPLIRIGGPGYVRVFMENAAIFEKADGSVRILSPFAPKDEEARRLHFLSGSSKYKRSIDGFERLRTVIDLRNHSMDLVIKARTRDGVEIRADDFKVWFSVYRGRGSPEDEDMPMPYLYDEEAIKRLVYRQSKGKWTDVTRTLVILNLRDFINQHDLIQLLACYRTEKGTGHYHFVLREEMVRLFASNFKKIGEARGVQVEWLGLGTWKAVLPNVEQDLVSFWNANNKIEYQHTPDELNLLYLNAFYDELQRLMISPVEVLYHYILQEQKGTRFSLNPSAQFHTTDKITAEIKRNIAKSFRENLYRAMKLDQDSEKASDDVNKVLEYLKTIT